MLRTFEVAATEAPGGVDPEIRKQVHDALIAQFPARARRPATFVGLREPDCRPTRRAPQTMLAHHMAKVLAYTGEPDVIGKILAVMPKGDDDQPGQIDYMYALRVIDQGWTRGREEAGRSTGSRKASKWRGGSTFAGHVNNIFDATVDVVHRRRRSRRRTRRRRSSRR